MHTTENSMVENSINNEQSFNTLTLVRNGYQVVLKFPLTPNYEAVETVQNMLLHACAKNLSHLLSKDLSDEQADKTLSA